MKNPTGRVWPGQCALCLLLLLLAAVSAARADVSATLDRERAAMGDTLRLTITATGDEDISSVDLQALQADFEVLRRSTASNTSIVNGRRSHSRQLQLDITPRREGTLRIPALQVGRHATQQLVVTVDPAPESITGDETVVFSAELDRDSVFVQGQVLLTLRLQQAINLEERSITELQLDDAFVVPLEQKSFQRTVDGRPWLVHEVRYAIFPEHSGRLQIPPQVFSARESQARRSFFDPGGGRQIRRRTRALSVEVKPRPAAFPGNTWLPARSLTIEETWSTPPDALRAGESTTRSITLEAEGLQGAQLPPMRFPATEGLKYYPDQPLIEDSEVASGLLGSRRDSAALVPLREGTWHIPEIRIPWWDTQSDKLRYAVLPGRDIPVAAAAPGSAPTPVPGALEAGDGTIALPPPAIVKSGGSRAWQAAAAISSAGWLLTLAVLLWSRRGPRSGKAPQANDPSESRAFKQLLAACAADQPSQARTALIHWVASLCPDERIVSLEQAAHTMRDDRLRDALQQLDAALYSSGGTAWQGAPLAAIARDLRRRHRQVNSDDAAALTLYPDVAVPKPSP
ncbi:MAG: protein BatD [Halioglobus sp.]|nr:protein BatD [Halioglobus sp.]